MEANLTTYIKKLKKLIEFKSNGTFELDTNYFSEINHEMPEYYSENFLKLLGKPIKKMTI